MKEGGTEGGGREGGREGHVAKERTTHLWRELIGGYNRVVSIYNTLRADLSTACTVQ